MKNTWSTLQTHLVTNRFKQNSMFRFQPTGNSQILFWCHAVQLHHLYSQKLITIL